MAVKIQKKAGKYLPNIIIIVCGILVLGVGIFLTGNALRRCMLKQWGDALSANVNAIASRQPEDDMSMQLLVENSFDHLYCGSEKVDTIAFFRRKGEDVFSSIFYSSAEWCETGITIQEFFRSVDAYDCYNEIMGNESGVYKYITVRDRSYYVLYAYSAECQISVVEFVPKDVTDGLAAAYGWGTAIMAVLLILLLAVKWRLLENDKRKLVRELDEAYQTMHDKDVRMDMLSYLMNEFTFEYDIEKDNLSFTEKYQTIFQRGKNFVRFRETLRGHYVVYHKDIDNLFAAFDEIMSGKEEGNVLFRLQMTGGNYEWFNAVYKVMYDQEHVPSFVVGKMVNVHQSQTEKEMLLKKSTRDPLTNLLNRSEMEKRTTAYIEGMDSEDLAALLIMDLDHFKQVNDTFGHSRGDDLLRDVAVVLRDSFRTNDIVGRLGGDEFFVFMKDIASEKDAVNKCEKLRLALHRDVTYGEKTVKISTSMGIIFVREGAQFLDIYMKADSALYRAKENGRNQICTYSEETISHEGENKEK